MIITIAAGVALGILIAAGLIYAGMRWGRRALHVSGAFGLWAWSRKLRIALAAAAIVVVPVAVVAADYAGILLYESFHSTAGPGSK